MAEIRVFASQAQRRRRKAASRRDLDGHRGYRRDVSACGSRFRYVGENSARAARGFRRQDSRVRRPRVHGVHASAAGRADDARLSPRVLRARSADRRRKPALRLRQSDDEGIARSRRDGRVLRTAARRQPGGSAADRGLRAGVVRAARARDQHADLSAQARLSLARRRWPAWARRSRSSRPTCAFSSSPGFGEVAEPFGRVAGRQLGDAVQAQSDSVASASARSRACSRRMPTSRGRTQRRTFLERTLDDSANRRTILPEALLCADEIVTLARKVIEGLRVDERRIAANLRTYAPFAGTEAVMMEAVRAGGDRQRLHEALRSASMEAWAAVGRGEDNPLSRLLTEERELTALVDPAEIRRLLDPSSYVGTAPQRARLLADRIESLAAVSAPNRGTRSREQRHRDRARQDEGAVRESRAAASARRRADRSDLGRRRRAPQRDRRQGTPGGADDGARVSAAQSLRLADALSQRRRRRRRQRDGRPARAT